MNLTKASELVTADSASGKKGEACAHSILGLIGIGDASIAEAKRKGGIKTVSSVDGENMAILGLYAKYCTIVIGN